MSASLVGSEMCIRDRVFMALVASRPRFTTRPLGASVATQGRRPGAPLDCLLYTSDAADDM
eukprot:15118313-Alexandrium_andersonii.AAC.1